MNKNLKTSISKLAKDFNLPLLATPGFLKEVKIILAQNNLDTFTDGELFKLLLSIFNGMFFTPIDLLETILTEQCNLQCDYCFVKKKRENSFSIATAKQALDFLILYSGNKKVLYYTLLGGESLLEFDTIFQLLNYADTISEQTEKKIYFDATTNGVLLSEEILKKGNGRIKYLLSIDGDEDTHNKHRRMLNGEGSFKEVFSKIDILKKYQPWVGTRMTICPDTVSKLTKNIDYLFNHGINQFLLGTCYGPVWDEKSLKIYEEEFTKVSEYYTERINKKDPFRITLFEKEENKNNCLNGIWGCRAGRNGVTVTSDGSIFPCSKFVGLESFSCNEFCLGNIYEGITNLSAREQLFNMQTEDFVQCTHCNDINSCAGGCPAENYHQNKSIYVPCKDQCELTKIQNLVIKQFWEKQKEQNEVQIPQ